MEARVIKGKFGDTVKISNTPITATTCVEMTDATPLFLNKAQTIQLIQALQDALYARHLSEKEK